MPALGRTIIDNAGSGAIQPAGSNTKVYCEGQLVSVVGDNVNPHPSGVPHSIAKMSVGSSKVFINGVAVCRAGDSATCGHTLSSGSGIVFSN